MNGQIQEQIAQLIADGRIPEASEQCASLRQTDGGDVRTWILSAAVCEAQGDLEAERDAIAKGLQINPHHAELYYMLGILYRYSNINQAYLCMEQAHAYCTDGEDRALIEEEMEALRAKGGFRVRGTSVIIVSYNDKDLMQKNIEAFRREMPKGAYEIIVVDNHSNDGVAEWLRDQTDIRLIENGENVGFPVAVNIGYRACDKENDVLLINNDAVPAEGALFWLRMGLYEDMNVGAVSAVSNNASMQTIADAPESFEDCMAFGRTFSVPDAHPYEERTRFTGFAVWIKQRAHLAVRMGKELLDARFSPGYFEDDDLGMRIARAGYRQLLCHNAFIYHRGGSGFFSREAELNASREKFAEKWGFDVWGYTALLDELLDAVTDAPEKPVRVLQLDAGMGIHLSALKYRYPYGFFAGIEQNPVVCGLAVKTADIICGDPETVAFPWPERFFDYIFTSDVPERATDRAAFLAKLNRYLAPDGKLIGL